MSDTNLAGADACALPVPQDAAACALPGAAPLHPERTWEGPSQQQRFGILRRAKSVAIAVRLQPVERTLTDTEIEAVTAKIVAEVARKTGATLRG